MARSTGGRLLSRFGQCVTPTAARNVVHERGGAGGGCWYADRRWKAGARLWRCGGGGIPVRKMRLVHSCRSAVTGSMCDARLAGT